MFGKTDSLPNKNLKQRKILLLSGTGITAIGTSVYLNKVWFSQYNTGKFHWFNDNQGWMQMDKFGHTYSCFTSGRLMMDAFDWAGFSKNQKLLYGGTMGLVYMTGFEIMDGFSAGWGFSYGDMLANAVGTGLAISQESLWNQQRIWLKYSYYESGLARYNPNLLGKNLPEKLLKDYNAQIYWLSFNPFVVFNKQTKVPKWINLSFGYGASGMLRAQGYNSVTYTSNATPPVEYQYSAERIRNYYFSLDIDFTQIKTKSKFLKAVFSCVNSVKIPAPALQFNKNGARFFYFR